MESWIIQLSEPYLIARVVVCFSLVLWFLKNSDDQKTEQKMVDVMSRKSNLKRQRYIFERVVKKKKGRENETRIIRIGNLVVWPIITLLQALVAYLLH